GGGCGHEDGVEKRTVINRRFGSEIKTHRCRKQNEQRQSCFDQLCKIANEAVARRRNSRTFNCGRFHAAIRSLCGAPGPAGAGRPTSVCEIRQQIAVMLTPKDNMTAPIATCAVAISAAFFVPITHAPNPILPNTTPPSK